MLKFNEYLVEQKEGSGLTIFDIDDTLLIVLELKELVT